MMKKNRRGGENGGKINIINASREKKWRNGTNKTEKREQQQTLRVKFWAG